MRAGEQAAGRGEEGMPCKGNSKFWVHKAGFHSQRFLKFKMEGVAGVGPRLDPWDWN